MRVKTLAIFLISYSFVNARPQFYNTGGFNGGGPYTSGGSPVGGSYFPNGNQGAYSSGVGPGGPYQTGPIPYQGGPGPYQTGGGVYPQSGGCDSCGERPPGGIPVFSSSSSESIEGRGIFINFKKCGLLEYSSF